jgi:leucyl-tRNA synthetase
MPKYNPAEIEPNWQRYWETHKTFRTPDQIRGKKVYILDMFPYPSGNGLHVGHPEGYTATDIVARFQRMRGNSVLHPMGFDAFGLPAEEHAIATNTPPRESTLRNIANFRRQLKMLGFSYDWDRELATTDVEYFRWTQWIFLVLFDTWYDDKAQRGRPIAELPIPGEISASGPEAVRRFQDEHRLAYQAEAPVNWCPALGTVLANEEVIDGKSERGSHPVQRIPLRQWMLRITAYADRLERDLESLEWSDGIKKLQRDWIGRSDGAEVDFFLGPVDQFADWLNERRKCGFPSAADDRSLRVFTTRPDTLFGATYMVLAPEHPLVDALTTSAQRAAVEKYREQTGFKSDRERQEEKKKKTGVFTGAYAVNPVHGKQIPIWIADYVLVNYGTGAIMAVPGQDQRDWDFAKAFGLPIVRTVQPPDGFPDEAYLGDGHAINSDFINGLKIDAAKQAMVQWLSERGIGHESVNYKIRDWLFSRQRFWGEPFPILHELDADGEPNGAIRAVPIEQLPVDLPKIDDYRPHGRPEPPLEKADASWLYPVIDGKKYKRETNTMPQWAGSCWYFLRFIDPANGKQFVDPALEKRWMPIDLYVGGAEHAVLHLLYSRFWHKVLYDRGHVSTVEPFQKLVNQGMILGEMEYTGYRDFDEKWVSSDLVNEDDEGNAVVEASGAKLMPVRLIPDQVEKHGDAFVLKSNPDIRVASRAYKMSKSRGNVVNPDEIVADHGADALRLYEMFMGPLEATKPWSMTGVNGVRGFLDRVWRMMIDDRAEKMQLAAAITDQPASDEQLRVLHKTIRAVTTDIEAMSFNTAIARMMEFVNYFTKQSERPRSVMESFVLLLSPFAPHIAEELWKALGGTPSLAHESWPKYDEALARDEFIEIPIQIKGKVRTKIQVPPGISKDELELAARRDDRVVELLHGMTVQKVIVVPDRLVNFVAS